jgi:hypothetical protein
MILNEFSMGDIIAIGFGSVAILRWGMDFFIHGQDEQGSRFLRVWNKIESMETRMIGHIATDETEFKWIKESLTQAHRKLDNVQSQLRNVATGSHNKASEMRDD